MKKISPKLVKRFLTDFDFYAQTCLQIRTKQAYLEPFKMNFAQRHCNARAKAQFAKYGYVKQINLKARQEGVSTWVAGRGFRRAHLIPLQDCLIIAHDTDTSGTLFGMYERFKDNLPPEVKPMVRASSRSKEVVFDNPDEKKRSTEPGLGSQIAIETANNTEAGRSKTLQFVHASEAAFWEKPEETMLSLNQAIADYGSEFYIESTANGVGNLFHQTWEDAVEGRNDFDPIFLPWFIHDEYTWHSKLDTEQMTELLDTLDEEEAHYFHDGIEWEGTIYHLTAEQLWWRRWTIRNKTQGSERKFRQEYPATAEEAFLVSGNCFFDEVALKLHLANARPPKIRCNIKREGGAIRAPQAERGHLRIWMRPGEKRSKLDLEPVYVIGADTATGKMSTEQRSMFDDPDSERGGRDFSCGQVIDLANRRQVAELHGRMRPDVFAQQLAALGYYYSSRQRTELRTPALVAVEKNHDSGETVLKVLKKELRYPRLFSARTINRRLDRIKDQIGWLTSPETRMPMLDDMERALREDTIAVFSGDLLRECRTFIVDEDGKPQAEEGCHDDRVIAFAIALQMANYEIIAPPKNFHLTEMADTGSSPTGLFDYA